MTEDRLRICALSEIPAKGARGFDLDWNGRQLALIVLRDHGVVRAYLNSCPHTGVRLEMRSDDFFDLEGQSLQCTTHGARFAPGDGRCLAGPCRGQALIRAPVEERTDGLYLRGPDQLPRSARQR